MVTKCSFCHNLTVASKQKTYLTKVVKEYVLMKEIPFIFIYVKICSFRHNFTGASNQKTSLTKVVKKYALIKEMSWKPLNMEAFGHKMFILLQSYWCL